MMMVLSLIGAMCTSQYDRVDGAECSVFSEGHFLFVFLPGFLYGQCFNLYYLVIWVTSISRRGQYLCKNIYC